MGLILKEMLQNLGVPTVLSAYETYPWFMYDVARAVTCSAEVRMGPGCSDMVAELQFMYDDPEAAGKPNPEQICLMKMTPTNGGYWSPQTLIIRGEDYAAKLSGWQEKGPKFFLACIMSIQKDRLPNIDKLIDRELSEDEESGGDGRIGRKAPKVNRQAMMGMKK